jgi:hypothetical protein
MVLGNKPSKQFFLTIAAGHMKFGMEIDHEHTYKLCVKSNSYKYDDSTKS